MWTYRNNIEPIQTVSGNLSLKKKSTLPIILRKQITNCCSKRRSNHCSYFLKTMSFIYTLGIIIGIIISKLCNSIILDYMKCYVTNTIARFIKKQYTLIFCTEFLSLFFQVTLIVLSGLCVFGFFLIPIIALLKGIGTGCFFSLIYLEFGIAKGFFIETLFLLIPEIIGVIFLFSISKPAWNLSKDLLNGCLRIQNVRLAENFKTMFYQYLKLCCISIFPALFSILTAFIFSPLF